VTTASLLKPMPELPRPGQKVRWRDPEQARAFGWVALLGPGPFEVVRVVNRSDHGLAAGLAVHTTLGEREIPEVWLALAEDPDNGTCSRQPAGGQGQPV
jgi:hypothetical protein